MLWKHCSQVQTGLRWFWHSRDFQKFEIWKWFSFQNSPIQNWSILRHSKQMQVVLASSENSVHKAWISKHPGLLFTCSCWHLPVCVMCSMVIPYPFLEIAKNQFTGPETDEHILSSPFQCNKKKQLNRSLFLGSIMHLSPQRTPIKELHPRIKVGTTCSHTYLHEGMPTFDLEWSQD